MLCLAGSASCPRALAPSRSLLAGRPALPCRPALQRSFPQQAAAARSVRAQGQQQYGGGQQGYYPPVYQSPLEQQQQANLDEAAKEKLQVGTALRNIGWLSFWAQLVLNTVSAVILLFSTGVSGAGRVALSFIDIATLGGVVAGFISTFLAWSWIRAGRRLGMLQDVKLAGVAGTVLASTNLNLVGMGATIIGLQATVGSLVSKTLMSAAANPYAIGARGVTTPPPVALDVFSVQANTNTILAHFVAILFSNWLLSVLNKYSKKQEAREAEASYDATPSAPPIPPGMAY